jgi:aerobic-type carbon monoxide dehydrogenase small subunit (CoxS/CutS family)
MIMRAQALISVNQNPSAADIARHLQPNLCRCGTHMQIVKAVQRAAQLMKGRSAARWSLGRAAK